MNRILLAMAASLMFSLAIVSPVTADENKESKMTPVVDDIPAPSALKVSDGVAEGHKTPLEVFKKAIAAAKAGEMDKLKTCFNPSNLDWIDGECYGEMAEDGETTLTYLQALSVVLKGYSDAGEQRSQGSIGNYAIIAVKNGEAVNLVKTTRVAKWTDKGEEKDKNWYLSSIYPSEYRIDYNAPDVKGIREAIEKGDAVKIKDYLDPWQCQALDLISGVQEGVDPYALLVKRLQGVGSKDTKPTILLDSSGTRLAYWWHTDKTDAAPAKDGFVVLNFWEDWGWDNDGKKSTKVRIDIAATNDFLQKPAETYTYWVQDWTW